MSRTYRKRSYHWSQHLIWEYDSRYKIVEVKSPTKEQKARHRMQGGDNTYQQYYFDIVNKAGRINAREQFHILRSCEDYEDFHFDPSKYIKKRKEVWWEIY